MRRSVTERLARGRSIGEIIDDDLGAMRVGPLREGTFTSRLHDQRIAAILGLALGVAFITCFITGLVSHFAQHPLDIGFLSMPASPGWLYRVTQGLHVVSGTAAIPLLMVKLWAVFPKLFTWPPVENLAHAVERLSLFPLVAGSVFMLFSGLANTARWYPWEFSFTPTHFWTAWIVIGALIAHIGAKITITRRALRRAPQSPDAIVAEPPGDGLSRRGLLAATAAAVAAVVATTAGQTVRPLKGLAVLAPRRPDVGPQGLPVNRTAAGAGVLQTARESTYELVVGGRVERELRLTLADLRAMPLREADLPITCVEGWSAGARWRGVPVRDLLDLAGAPADAEVSVHSLQARGSYRTSVLNGAHSGHPDTLLALDVNGSELALDHGYPARLIAPNRPGVQQTKWVNRLEVL